MEGNREISAVIDGRIKTCYLCFTYTPVSTFSFVFSWTANFKGLSEVPEFSVNSLSILYRCAIHNLPTLRIDSIYFILVIQIMFSLTSGFWWYALAAAFTNVRTLRVPVLHQTPFS